MATSLVQLAWQRYLSNLQARPLKTKALTSAAIAGISDAVAQQIIFGSTSNWKRTLAMGFYGLIWSGPSAHYWQRYLEVLFRGRNDLWTVLRKVVLDQGTYGPLCNLLFMSYATLVLEGRGLRYLKKRVKADYPLVQLNGWKLWPLAALFNYAVVPLQFRVLFINLVALGWSVFLLLQAKGQAQAKGTAQGQGKSPTKPAPVKRA